MRFLGRTRELALLQREFESDRESLVITYGRRRVGKTRLLREAARGRPSIYFQATRVTEPLNLEQFKEAVSALAGPSPILDGIGTWEASLHFLAALAATDYPGLVVVMDEFPYIAQKDQALPSVIQRFWDSGAPRRGNLKLVLCGSAIAQMQELLAERCPLHGRHTMSLELRQLPLREAAQFYPEYSAEDIVTAYSIFGGVPHYLTLCDPSKSLRDNVVDLLLTETGPLFDEPDTVLQNELSDPTTYAGIIAAMSEGKRTSTEIADRLRLATKDISPYLANLRRLDLVHSERSLDADDRARNFRYALNDRLMAFWHHFVRSNISAIQNGFGEAVYDQAISPSMSDFMGGVFEIICREHAALHSSERLGSPAQSVGHIWGYADFDMDVAGSLLDRTYFYGECKWKSGRVGRAVLAQLQERAEKVKFGSGSRGKKFLLYARSGFTKDVLDAARVDASIHPVGLDEMVWGPSSRRYDEKTDLSAEDAPSPSPF